MAGRIVAIAFAALVGVLGLIVVFGSWFTVDQGSVAVILRNGAVVGTAGPGFNFKMPWISSAVEIETRQQKWTRDQIEAYSKDLQPANLTITINYHVNASDAGDLYGRYGTNYADTILTPAVLSAVKIVFGQFDAPTAIANRAQMVIEMQKAVQSALSSPDIYIDALQLENVKFSDQFMAAVETRMQREIEVQQELQNLAKQKVQADILRTSSAGVADQTRNLAKANADAVGYDAAAQANKIKLIGEATAEAIKARSAALQNNPELVSLTAVERWNGILPATMVPGSTVPFLNVNPLTP